MSEVEEQEMQAKYDRQQRLLLCTPGVWFLIVNYCLLCGKLYELEGESCMNWREKAGARMLRKQKICCWQCMGLSVSLLLQTHTCTKFAAPEACFHAELISASPIIIACKTVQLCKFLLVHCQCKRTINANVL